MGACLVLFGGQPFAFALGNADRSQWRDRLPSLPSVPIAGLRFLQGLMRPSSGHCRTGLFWDCIRTVLEPNLGRLTVQGGDGLCGTRSRCQSAVGHWFCVDGNWRTLDRICSFLEADVTQ